MSHKYEPRKAHRLVYHSTLGSRVIKKKQKSPASVSYTGIRPDFTNLNVNNIRIGRAIFRIKSCQKVFSVTQSCPLQGCLAHKNPTPPQGFHRALGIVLL